MLALRLDPRLLARLAPRFRVLAVTGTNGKTTTTRLACAAIRETGQVVVTNRSGANLAAGLATTLLSVPNRVLFRGESRPTAVLEVDEAAYARVAKDLAPAATVVTNLFRDQLDRYGELEKTRSLLGTGLASGGGIAVLNADDALVATLSADIPNPVLYYGFSPDLMDPDRLPSDGDAAYCRRCGTHYTYEGVVFGHFGAYRCGGCGFRRPEPDVRAAALRRPGEREWQRTEEDLPEGGFLTLEASGRHAAAAVPFAGDYNLYNVLAAGALLHAAGFDLERAGRAFADADTGFGRMERIPAGDRTLRILLVKNPAGLTQAMDHVSRADDAGGALFLLNDNAADGRDVSWIWDADLEDRPLPGTVGVSGLRAEDMALRLRYAGIPEERIRTGADPVALLHALLEDCPPGSTLYILPTYTAMLSLRARLRKEYPLPDFWE